MTTSDQVRELLSQVPESTRLAVVAVCTQLVRRSFEPLTDGGEPTPERTRVFDRAIEALTHGDKALGLKVALEVQQWPELNMEHDDAEEDLHGAEAVEILSLGLDHLVGHEGQTARWVVAAMEEWADNYHQGNAARFTDVLLATLYDGEFDGDIDAARASELAEKLAASLDFTSQ